MEKLLFILLLLFLTNTIRGQVVKVNLQEKFIIKTDLPYEKVKQMNPDIVNYDIVGGNYVGDSAEFSIALYNANRNNKYDEKEDILIVSTFDAKAVSIYPSVSSQPIAEVNTIECDGKKFSVIEIDEKGTYVKIKPLADDLTNPDLKVFNKVPDINFKAITGDTINFRSFLNKEKYVFVEFWASWCHNCLENFSILKAYYRNYADQLTLISLNIGDSPNEIQDMIKKYDLNWTQGYSTDVIGKEFLLYGNNYGALFDPSGKLVLICHEPEEIKRFIDK